MMAADCVVFIWINEEEEEKSNTNVGASSLHVLYAQEMQDQAYQGFHYSGL